MNRLPGWDCVSYGYHGILSCLYSLFNMIQEMTETFLPLLEKDVITDQNSQQMIS